MSLGGYTILALKKKKKTETKDVGQKGRRSITFTKAEGGLLIRQGKGVTTAFIARNARTIAGSGGSGGAKSTNLLHKNWARHI